MTFLHRNIAKLSRARKLRGSSPPAPRRTDGRRRSPEAERVSPPTNRSGEVGLRPGTSSGNRLLNPVAQRLEDFDPRIILVVGFDDGPRRDVGTGPVDHV